MPSPARGLLIGSAGWRIDLFELSINGLVVIGLRGPFSVMNLADLNPGADIAVNRRPNARNKQGKPDGIGEKPGRQKKRARKQDHRAMRQRFGGIAQFIERSAQLSQSLCALAADKICSENRGKNDDCKGWHQPDPAADLNEKCDLNQRNGKKKHKQPHGDLALLGGAVDLTPHVTYICPAGAGTNPCTQ